jgi:hypothetical protein
MTFQPGDTVRLSKLGESRMKRAPAKTGKIVAAGNRNLSPNWAYRLIATTDYD